MKKYALLYLLCFVLPFFVYLLTLCPTVYVGDSGEMITAAYYLGIPHPPGYPLFTIAGHLFTYLPLATIAYRVNLLSSFLGSLTILMLFLFLNRIATSFTFPTSATLITFFGSLVFAFTKTFWHQSLIAKGGLYTLNTLILILIFYLLIKLNNTKLPGKVILLLGIVCGAGLSNHNTMVPLTFIFLGYILWFTYESNRKKLLLYFFTFLALETLVVLVTYLYLPIRSSVNPPLDWGNTENLHNFIRHITRQQYQIGEKMERTLSLFLLQLLGYLKAAVKQSNFFYAFIPFGLYLLWKQKFMFLLLLLIIFTLTSIGFAYFLNYQLNSHDIYIIDPFLIPSYLVLTILGTAGLIFLYKKLESVKIIRYLIFAVILFSLLNALLLNYFKNDKSKNTIAYIYGINLLKSMDTHGIVFVAGDNATFITCYLKKVELKAPDITVYDDTGNVFENIYGADFHKLEYASYYKRLNDTQWNLIQITKRPVYCVTGSNLFNSTNLTTRSSGMLFKVLKNKDEVIHKIDINKYNTSTFEDETLYKDFLTREVIALFYFALAEYCFENNDKKNADVFYDKTILVGNDMDTIQNNLGTSFIKKGILDKAEIYCKRAIEINPKFADAYNNLGIIYYKKGLFNDAIKYYLKAIQIVPRDSYFYNLGQLYRQANMPEDAAKIYEKALEINPYISKAHFLLGNAYLDKENYDKAVESYQKGLKIEPNSYEIYTNLGVTYDKKGMYDNAINAFNNSLKINPNVAETHYGLACVYFHQKKYQDAVKEYKISLKLDLNLAEGWNSLGVVMNILGNIDEVINCYTNLTKLRTNDVEAWNNLGIAYGTKGDFKNAIYAWEQALKVAPHYLNARLNIEKVRGMMK